MNPFDLKAQLLGDTGILKQWLLRSPAVYLYSQHMEKNALARQNSNFSHHHPRKSSSPAIFFLFTKDHDLQHGERSPYDINGYCRSPQTHLGSFCSLLDSECSVMCLVCCDLSLLSLADLCDVSSLDGCNRTSGSACFTAQEVQSVLFLHRCVRTLASLAGHILGCETEDQYAQHNTRKG